MIDLPELSRLRAIEDAAIEVCRQKGAGDSIRRLMLVCGFAADPLDCPYDAIVEAYHAGLPANPRCKVLNDARRRLIRTRWREAAKLAHKPFGYQSQDGGIHAWLAFFKVAGESDFLTGKIPPRPGQRVWKADFDFFMSPSGFAKTLENRYHHE